MEKRYAQLNPSTTSKVKKVVSGVLGSVGKQIITNAIADAGTKYAKKIISGG